jgi:uncharacterized membrane protein (DUF4010 family)
MLGVERERSGLGDQHRHFAGIRTFPIGALIGFLCGLHEGVPVLVAGLVGVSALVTAAYFKATREEHPGITTEASYILTFLLGAACARGMVLEASSTALVVTMLLAGKEQLHGFAQALPQKDVAAALKFGVISLIILPVIPNREFGKGWWAVNFYKTWLMVVLMAGIGFAGYILTRVIGPRGGTGLAGLVGGLVSSTAVTMTFSKRSREAPALSGACSLAIVAACAVLYVRVFAEALIVNAPFARSLALPLAILFGFSVVLVALLWSRAAAGGGSGETGAVPYKNPVELAPAIQFALLFAGVTMVFRLAHQFGARGTWTAAFLSGLSDMDAVTLSTAQLTRDGGMTLRDGSVAVLLAATANTLVKLGLALAFAGAGTRRQVGSALGATTVVAVALMVWEAMT